jgi:integrase
MERIVMAQGYTSLKEKFFAQLSLLNYSAATADSYKRVFARVETFMARQGITGYSSEVGKAFVEDAAKKRGLARKSLWLLNSATRRLAELIENDEFKLRKKKTALECPEIFMEQLNNYEGHLRLQGRRGSTIEVYGKLLRKTLVCFRETGIKNLSELRAQDIYDAFKKSSDKLNFSTPVKSFLKYLFKKGIHDFDLSLIVPSVRRPKVVPSIYSKTETGRLLAAIDRTTSTGKRDYAVILLGLRLGIRAGDIANLKMSDLDFSAKTISFKQGKTLVPQKLELLPEVEDALLEYFSDGSASRYGSPYVFLSTQPPFGKMSRDIAKNIARKYFKAAGIDPAGRKHGSHALRMTLASELAAENVPYGVIRKILGHEDTEAIKRYVKFDIKMLQKCALEVPRPSGLLAGWLSAQKGGRML